MNSPSWSSVGLRKTGAVSRMKSFQNCPGSSSVSGGGPSRISRSSNPCASRLPANDSSITNTTRCPRSRSTCPMPTQLFVGPYAPSGKNTIVAACCSMGPLARSRSLAGVANLREPSATFNTDLLVGARWFAGKGRTVAEVPGRRPARARGRRRSRGRARRRRVRATEGRSATRSRSATAGSAPGTIRSGRRSRGPPASTCDGSGRFLAEDLSNTVVLLDDAARPEALPAPGAGHPSRGRAPRRARGLAACAHRWKDASSATASRTSRVQASVAGRAGGLGAARSPRPRREASPAHSRLPTPARASVTALAALTPSPSGLGTHRGRAPAGARRPPRRPVPPLRRDARRGRLGGPAEPDARRARAARDPPSSDLASLRLSLAHAARAAHRRSPGFDWRAWSVAARDEALGAYGDRGRPRAPPCPRAREGAGRARVREALAPRVALRCRPHVLPFVLEERP